MKARTTTKLVKNKKMNQDTYKLRREVMELIYEAKALTSGKLPRIEVRIADKDTSILGVATVGGNVIWITDGAIKQAKYDLRTVVYHEIVHAVYGVRHIETCPLMKAVHTPLTKAKCQKLFLKYVK
jgi:hypothetical protein